MSSPAHERLKRILETAFELPAAERQAFLERECAGDEGLRRDIESLLAHDVGDLSETPALDTSFDLDAIEPAEASAARPGSPLDPQAAPEPVGAAEGEFVSEVVRRLAGRSTHGRYQLKGEIAKGGMGAVLRIWDEDLRRYLAMKVLPGKAVSSPSPGAPPDPRSLARFLEEAQVTGQLDHPGIVPVHELGVDSRGRVYFTMKLVKGRTLKEVFELAERGEEGWTKTGVLSVLLKVCEAMAYAHHKGVVHRDLKPGNIMVGRFGEVYVMDWGLAKVLGRTDHKDVRIAPHQALTVELVSERQERAGAAPDSPLMTMDGHVVGTPVYMSPEQALGKVAEIGPHSDVFSLGAMLYHLLTGQAPYMKPGMRLSNYAIWYRVQEGPPEPLHECASDVPAELAAIVEKAMAREPGERYHDTLALAEDLRAYLEHRVVKAYQRGAVAELRKWIERNRGLAAAIAAAFLLLALGLTASLVFKAQSDRNAVLAKASEALADDRRTEAEARRDEVLQLSALQDLEDLLADADRLWPACPDLIGRYGEWLDRARELVSGLPVHRAKRAELRAKALPYGAEERLAQHRKHPDHPELARLEGEIASGRHALAQRRDGVPAELPEVDWSRYPQDAAGLEALAWRRVSPRRGVFGEEALGFVLARRALELARAEERASAGNTLAWACFALGRDDEALNAGSAALEAASETVREEFRARLEKLEQDVVEAGSAEGLSRVEAELDQLEARRAELEARMDEQRDWRFPDQEREARWWNNQLTKLIGELEVLEAGLLEEDAVSPEHGWSVPKRLAFAEHLQRGFAEGGEYARAWAEALPAMRAAYPMLALEPQLGLVPIGRDRDSGLWEFVHLQTGNIPARDEKGRLLLTEESGLVFVLLPGGTFVMGAQATAPSDPSYDPQAADNEKPVHEVTLSPFFLSKYEMTQGQWLRFTSSNPSFYQPPSWLARSLLHPVEQLSWNDCARVCQRLGLALPSEAQWEYGARGGTGTVWWTGNERASLVGATNLADRTAARAGFVWTDIGDWPELEDGYAVHAPVNSYRPNAVGLHNVHGNVWEWCQDGFDESFYARSPEFDPLTESPGSPLRVYRGGSYYASAALARSAERSRGTPVSADPSLGLRPARALQAAGLSTSSLAPGGR